MFDWSECTSMHLRFIEPGKPVQNAIVESYDGKFRDECLNLNWFRPQQHASGETNTTPSALIRRSRTYLQRSY